MSVHPWRLSTPKILVKIKISINFTFCVCSIYRHIPVLKLLLRNKGHYVTSRVSTWVSWLARNSLILTRKKFLTYVVEKNTKCTSNTRHFLVCLIRFKTVKLSAADMTIGNPKFRNSCWTLNMAFEGRAMLFTGIEFGVVISIIKWHHNFGYTGIVSCNRNHGNI